MEIKKIDISKILDLFLNFCFFATYLFFLVYFIKSLIDYSELFEPVGFIPPLDPVTAVALIGLAGGIINIGTIGFLNYRNERRKIISIEKEKEFNKRQQKIARLEKEQTTLGTLRTIISNLKVLNKSLSYKNLDKNQFLKIDKELEESIKELEENIFSNCCQMLADIRPFLVDIANNEHLDNTEELEKIQDQLSKFINELDKEHTIHANKIKNDKFQLENQN
ncbi:hypothetical protein H6G80_29930 [Nostoc sp. FACHB-87]|uniref:hypothetical protein n=1 Tax=Nostocaceae TaxID=1162 RepID=UPI0016889568|nr:MULTISPECIES: hypothetical protein [Nostocaceae]MBD2458273.1 hypothetical protein [Nostoc sp. FACHB-87]MBD2480058.1 hypothetical protein [Anabaena sp. FACHB-83]